MPSWSSASASAASADHASVVRLFVEASRRAEFIAVINSARTEHEVAQATADEVCEALEAEVAFVSVTRPEHGERETIGQTGLTGDQAIAMSSDALCATALGRVRPEVHRGSDLLGIGARHVAFSPCTAENGRQVVIGVARFYDEPFEPTELALLEAVTASVTHGLERSWIGAERDRHAARQAALVRAAKSLSSSLDSREVLSRLVREVGKALEADVVRVYAALDCGDMEVIAGTEPPGTPGAPAAGNAADVGLSLAECVTREGKPVIRQPSESESPLEGSGTLTARSGLAAPLAPSAGYERVLMVGFRGCRTVETDDVDLLMAFAEIGAIAWRNASDHGAVRRAATLDSLTGCLNHGAFQDRLREEVSRAQRTTGSLAVAILDLNDFKAVNDHRGHLAGDAVLRRVAGALRAAVRPYDQVARYGGDEFAVLLPDTDEQDARRVVGRAEGAISETTASGASTVTAGTGTAFWRTGDTADTLLKRADDELLEAKRARKRDARTPSTGAAGGGVPRAEVAAGEGQRWRRLATAGTLGTRLARLLDQRAIAETAMVELGGALGYTSCVLVQRDRDGAPSVVATAADERTAAVPEPADPISGAVRRCLLERHPVLLDPAGSVSSELGVPIYVGTELWGAVGVRSSQSLELDDEDVQLVQRVADHLGTALQSAALYEQLEETHLGTAAALAAALEAKDRYTADHARSMADLAVEVGSRLGVDDAGLRDLRYGAIFHDIGKIAVPDAILNKPGPLTEPELSIVREHPIVGERILAPVPFLSRVRRIVRHDHERWDGGGYPDALSGDAIPLGARIVLVVDAYHAMRSNRPYRQALTQAAARAELLRHSGTQFDPRVVDALLAVLVRDPFAATG